jgi:hypothetical protein
MSTHNILRRINNLSGEEKEILILQDLAFVKFK